MAVSYICCVLSGRGLYYALTTRPRESIECGVSESVPEATIRTRPWPSGAVAA